MNNVSFLISLFHHFRISREILDPRIGKKSSKMISSFALKKLTDQVIVLTGATSGIGLVTARMAARQGATLVVAARNTDALKQLTEELERQGATTVPVVADVGVERDCQCIADAAIERFGRIDTWINNAGVSIFGRHEEVTSRDNRQLFEINFWGVVYGSLAAVRCMKLHGGALINIGSGFADRAAPLQGMYSASKHAVKGFTDSLRMELEEERAPISVTLIKPSSVNSMLTEHAKNYQDVRPRLPPPLYAPETVAKAILHAAQRPQESFMSEVRPSFSGRERITCREFSIGEWSYCCSGCNKPASRRIRIVETTCTLLAPT